MRRTRLRPVSDRRRAEKVDYLALVRALAEEDDRCEVCPIIVQVDPSWRGCTGRMSGLHHIAKRSQWRGGLLVRANVLRACNPGNRWVEDHPELAHRAGLVVRPGDAEWQRLRDGAGARGLP